MKAHLRPLLRPIVSTPFQTPFVIFHPSKFTKSSFSTSLPSHQSSSSPPPTNQPSVPVTLIAQLRQTRPVPISLAREALQATNNSLESAIIYLDDQASSTISKKADKLSSRSTSEGVIAISLLGDNKRVGMVHVGCETDFVARNEIFLKTARNIASTCAFLDVPGTLQLHHLNGGESDQQILKKGEDPILNFPVEALMEAPLISIPSQSSSSSSPSSTSPSTPSGSSPNSSVTEIPIPSSDPQTISQTLLSTLSQTGENLKLLRAISFAAPFPSSPLIRYIPSAYTHGGSTSTEGKIGGIIIISAESTSVTPISSRIHGPGGDELNNHLSELAGKLARQVVGFQTKMISRNSSSKDVQGEMEDEGDVLLDQQAMMFGRSETVSEVINEWGKEKEMKIEIIGFRRWAVNDDLGDSSTSSGSPSR